MFDIAFIGVIRPAGEGSTFLCSKSFDGRKEGFINLPGSKGIETGLAVLDWSSNLS